MARQEIILGTAPTGLGGDPPRTASTKINAMTLELYSATNSLGTAATRVAQTARKANNGEVLVAGLNGLGTYIDLRGSLYSTGQPADILGTGTNIGFADGGELGIPGLAAGTFGVLHSNAQWTNPAAGAGTSQTFEAGLTTWRRYPLSSTTWRSWEQVGGQIVGLTSAGAIMERGSTSSGEFTKFASGLMICWTSSIQPALINASNIGVSWTYPAAFIAAPSVSANLGVAALGVTKTFNGPHAIGSGATQTALYMLSRAEFVAGDVSSVTFQAKAVGWWK